MRESADAWIADNATRLSASLAFYVVLSIVPFSVVITAIAANVFGENASQQLIREIRNLTGAQGAHAIRGLIQLNHKSATVTLVSLLTLALGTSAAVMELRDALNAIWHVQAPAAESSGVTGLVHLVRERFYLFGLIAGAGLLMVVSLAFNTLLAAVISKAGLFMPVSPWLVRVVTFAGSFLVVTILFAAIYKLVPDVRLKWNDVMVGAGFTSLLFTIGKQLIGVYLGTADYASTYGAAGSFVIILVWVYYSAQLFFFGAEFTRVFARRIHPRKSIELAQK